jgi:hypothetical protein
MLMKLLTKISYSVSTQGGNAVGSRVAVQTKDPGLRT